MIFTHFFHSFFPHVSNIIYASVNGIYPNNPKKNNYSKLKRRIWPIVKKPHTKLNGKNMKITIKGSYKVSLPNNHLGGFFFILIKSFFAC